MKLPWWTKITVSTLGMSRWTTTAMINLGGAVIAVQFGLSGVVQVVEKQGRAPLDQLGGNSLPTRSETDPEVSARTSGVYLRADPEDLSILDGRDDRKRAELIAERLSHWKSITSA